MFTEEIDKTPWVDLLRSSVNKMTGIDFLCPGIFEAVLGGAGLRARNPVRTMIRRQHCEHTKSKQKKKPCTYVLTRAKSTDVRKGTYVLFMLFQLLLLLRVLLLRYAFSCSNAHVVFVVAVILISDVWSILSESRLHCFLYDDYCFLTLQ